MIRQYIKRLGRRIAGSWGRTAKKKLKRQANKATRKFKFRQEKEL